MAIEEGRRSGGGIAISDMTLLEIAVLESKHRIELRTSLETFLSEIEARFAILPMNSRVCVRAMAPARHLPQGPSRSNHWRDSPG